MSEARGIDSETLSVAMFERLKLDEKLTACGFNKKELSAALGTIVGRMIHRIERARNTPLASAKQCVRRAD
ncbi:MAG: hypothetical protein ACI9Y1_003070 [Lentisphaeria bacterium]